MADDDKLKIIQLLNEILRENLEISRQNNDEIRESVDSARELAKAYRISNEQAKSINQNNRDLAKINANLIAFEEKRLGHLRNSKDIGKDILKTEGIRLKLGLEARSVADKLNIAKKAGDSAAIENLTNIQRGLQTQINLSHDMEVSLQEEARIAKKIENSFGLSGKSLKVINKLLGGSLGDTQTILDNTQKRLALLEKEGKLQGGLAGKMQGFGVVVGEVGKSIGKNLNDPLTYLAAGLSWDTSVVKLQKSLAISRTEAAILRDDITDIAAVSFDSAINAERVQKAYMNLNQAFGVASADLLKNHGEVVLQSAILQERWGLSAESTAELAKAAIVAGKPLEQIKLDIIGAVTAAEAQYGAHLNIKEVTEAVGKVTGQVRAQLAGNPALIAEAVAVAKELGFELEQIAKSANTFLNFESSISAELEAELLTGKQLNLEIARSAALTGDYKTVAEEVAKNVGGWADFTKMNVIQQEKLAAAVGMTADELSDSLMKQENLKELAEEARAAGDEDLAKQIEARDAQQQFADAVEKVKGIFVDLVGGPVGQLLTVIAEITSVIAGVLAPVLNVLFWPIKEITPYLDTILKTTLALVGAYYTLKFLGDQQYRTAVMTSALEKARLITANQTSFFKKATTYEMGLQEGSNKRNQIYENASYLTSIRITAQKKLNNILGTIGLVNEEGKFAIAQQGYLLELKNNATLVGKNALQVVNNMLSTIGLGIKKRGLLMGMRDMFMSVGNFILKMFTAGAKAPFPLNLVLPFVMGGLAGAAGMAIYSKFAKADDMVSGYGKQGYFKEGEVTLLNDRDQVAAGTDLFKSPPSSEFSPPPQPIQEKTVIVESHMKYDGYAATNVNNWDSATNSSKKFNSVSYDYD